MLAFKMKLDLKFPVEYLYEFINNIVTNLTHSKEPLTVTEINQIIANAYLNDGYIQLRQLDDRDSVYLKIGIEQGQVVIHHYDGYDDSLDADELLLKQIVSQLEHKQTLAHADSSPALLPGKKPSKSSRNASSKKSAPANTSVTLFTPPKRSSSLPPSGSPRKYTVEHILENPSLYATEKSLVLLLLILASQTNLELGKALLGMPDLAYSDTMKLYTSEMTGMDKELLLLILSRVSDPDITIFIEGKLGLKKCTERVLPSTQLIPISEQEFNAKIGTYILKIIILQPEILGFILAKEAGTELITKYNFAQLLLNDKALSEKFITTLLSHLADKQINMGIDVKQFVIAILINHIETHKQLPDFFSNEANHYMVFEYLVMGQMIRLRSKIANNSELKKEFTRQVLTKLASQDKRFAKFFFTHIYSFYQLFSEQEREFVATLLAFESADIDALIVTKLELEKLISPNASHALKQRLATWFSYAGFTAKSEDARQTVDYPLVLANNSETVEKFCQHLYLRPRDYQFLCNIIHNLEKSRLKGQFIKLHQQLCEIVLNRFQYNILKHSENLAAIHQLFYDNLIAPLASNQVDCENPENYILIKFPKTMLQHLTTEDLLRFTKVYQEMEKIHQAIVSVNAMKARDSALVAEKFNQHFISLRVIFNEVLTECEITLKNSKKAAIYQALHQQLSDRCGKELQFQRSGNHDDTSELVNIDAYFRVDCKNAIKEYLKHLFANHFAKGKLDHTNEKAMIKLRQVMAQLKKMPNEPILTLEQGKNYSMQ